MVKILLNQLLIKRNPLFERERSVHFMHLMLKIKMLYFVKSQRLKLEKSDIEHRAFMLRRESILDFHFNLL